MGNGRLSRPRPNRQRKRLRGGGAEVDARFRWPVGTLAQSALAPSGTGLSALVLKAAVARETGSISPKYSVQRNESEQRRCHIPPAGLKDEAPTEAALFW